MMKIEDVRVSERELLSSLPIFGLHNLNEEKLKLFVKHMREVVRKRKFEDLQKKENDV